MTLHTTTGLNRGIKSAGAKILHASRLNIGPRLILGFVFITLSMLAADAVILWQFHLVRAQAERLNGIDQKLVAVLRVHTSLLAFHDRLEELADSQDVHRLVTEGDPLRTAVLEDTRRAMNALTSLPSDLQRDPTILPTLHAVQSALAWQLEDVTTLASSGDWRAVHLRLANQVRPLESLTSELVEKVDHEAGEQQAQTVRNITRVQRLVFVVVPLIAILTLLIAATLGLAITRSITQPLARLVEGSKALARGEFQHEVSVTGNDELAHLGRVFNDSARRLQDLYVNLQQSKAFLAEAQRLSKTGSFGWKLSTGEINWSEETFRIFQYDRSTTPTVELVLRRVHPGDSDYVMQTIDTASRNKRDFEVVHRLLMPDGAVKHVHIVAHAERNESGEIEFVGAVMDVTAAKQAEEALRRSERYLAEAQRLSHAGSWAFNATTPLYWSEENCRIWGFDPQQGLPDRGMILQRIHPEDRGRLLEDVQKAVRERRDYDVELRIVLPDGAIRYIHGLGHPVFSSIGELVEVVGTNMDVTERKCAEDALRQAQADLAHISRVTTMGELTASLAHEIKQPISAAITNAKTCLRWLDRVDPNIAEGCEAALRIVKDVTRAADIIGRISLMFKKGSLQRELVDINELIQEMIVLLRGEANRYSIPICIELAEDLPKVMADRVQLQQVLMNLMLNGIDAMKDATGESELAIRSKSEDGHVLISVSDTGVGLVPDQAEQIFKAFFTTKDNGTGMGLPISRSIIESHGGRLWAAAASGCGATFQFTLPTSVAAHA